MGLDTLNFTYSNERGGVKNLFSHMEKHIDNLNVNTKNGKAFLTGRLGNYSIYINDNYVSFKGSLPKWYLNDNIQDLSRGDTQRAIEKLSDITHLSLCISKVNRLDFGVGLLMKHPPQLYYSGLGDLKYYNRLSMPKSIYYNNLNSQLIFYNKIDECKNKRVLIPQFLNDSHILRYELRYLKNIPKSFNTNFFEVQDIYKESNYIKIIDEWFSLYNNIFKIQKPCFKMKDKIKPNDIKDELALIGLQTLGFENVFQMVEDANKKGLFEHSKYSSRTKQMIKEIMTKESLTEPNELTLELSTKIKSIKANYR